MNKTKRERMYGGRVFRSREYERGYTQCYEHAQPLVEALKEIAFKMETSGIRSTAMAVKAREAIKMWGAGE